MIKVYMEEANMNVKKVYDESYYKSGTSNYKDYKFDTRFIQRAYDIDKYLRPNKVLEIGCALGYLVRTLRSLGIEAYGYDVSEYAINNADPLSKNYLKVSMDGNIPFDDTFDLVVAFDVLEHIPEPHIFYLIESIAKITETIFLCQPNYFDPWDRDLTHVTLYPKSWWINLFEKYGFQRIDNNKILEKFNYTNGILLSKTVIPNTIKIPQPIESCTDEEKFYFNKCKYIDIF